MRHASLPHPMSPFLSFPQKEAKRLAFQNQTRGFTLELRLRNTSEKDTQGYVAWTTLLTFDEAATDCLSQRRLYVTQDCI